MFELSVALKYLIPRWRQLSVSIISLISVLVIALVVWLIVVFFSVSHGLEKSWVQKLIALAAPLRVIPTDDYYRSYYYLIDSISENSDYSPKSIGQKLNALHTDPYNPEFDEEIPEEWPNPDLNKEGQLKDITKLAYSSIHGIKDIKGLSSSEYEITFANLQLNRTGPDSEQGLISQTAYLSAYDPTNPSLLKALLPPKENDSAHSTLWVSGSQLPASLPNDRGVGEGILVPKNYRLAGVLLGDQGYISYNAPSASMMQEHRIPVVVAGFYDPGILPIAAKVVLVNPSIVSTIRGAYQHQDSLMEANGINVRVADLADADRAKSRIEKAFKEAGIEKYWKVETYREYEYSKDLLQQLRSEKNLFRLIAAIIILVACSNIISMLIILVNDKKMEIGILRSMGATSRSIALIFGFCGIVMGMVGSALGTAAALLTLRHLDGLIGLISSLQGFDVFNPMFYGETMPNEVSFEALTFVIGATAVTSLIAGIVPAVKACLLQPSQVLRSE